MLDRSIPDLASGSSEEWIRVEQEIVEGGAEKKIEARSYPPKKKNRRQYTLWIDMFALQQWQAKAQKGEMEPMMFQSDAKVMLRAISKGDEALGQPWSPQKCLERMPPEIVAVHFSHDAIKNIRIINWYTRDRIWITEQRLRKSGGRQVVEARLAAR